MVIAADFSGLHIWAQALAVILLLELCVLLVIVAALTFMLAFGARWLQMHVIPLLNATVPRAKQALELTTQGTDRVVRGVAVVHGWRSGLEAAIRVLFQERGEAGAGQVAVEPGAEAQAGAMPPTATTSAVDAVAAGEETRAGGRVAVATPEDTPFVVRRDEPPRTRGRRTTPPAASAG